MFKISLKLLIFALLACSVLSKGTMVAVAAS